MTHSLAPLTGDRLLDSLDDEQRAAVESRAHRLFVLAGPGSGKTRVLTARVVHLLQVRGAPSHNIVAFTFSRAAAAEIRTRVVEAVGEDLAALLTVSTFHGMACRIIRAASREALDGRSWPADPWRVADEQECDEVLRGLFRGPTARPESKSTGIGAVRHASTTHAAYGRMGRGPEWALLLTWWRRLADLGLVHPDRLVPVARSLIAGDRGYHDPQARRTVEHVRFVLIDEGQDLTQTEWELATSLGSSPDVTVVADDRQAIYQWRGATAFPDVIASEARGGAESVCLPRSYRFATAVARHANQIAESLDTHGAPIQCLPGAERGTVEQGVPATSLRTYVAALAAQYGPAGVAVLARTRMECERVAGELGPDLARWVRREPDLYLRIGIAMLRLEVRPTDNAAARVVLAHLGLGAGEIERLAEAAGQARGLWEQAGQERPSLLVALPDVSALPWGAVGAVLGAEGWPESMGTQEALDALAEHEQADRFAECAAAGLVPVATAHASKGREWEAVVLLTSRDWPGPRPKHEELRVMFVGATRARQHLVVMES